MGKYSQGGQEKWLLDYFGDRVGTAIDVGANDGMFFSNTLLLEARGWRVLCIEPNPRCWRPLTLARKECMPYAISDYNGVDTLKIVSSALRSAYWVHGINPGGTALRPIISKWIASGEYPIIQTPEVEVRTLDTAIKESGIGTPDLLSIDVEGGEPEVLRGMTCRPGVIIVELNHKEAVSECLAPLGYDIAGITCDDGIFVRKQ